MKVHFTTSWSGGRSIVAASFAIFLLWLALPGGNGWWPLLGIACVPFLIAIQQGSRRQGIVTALFFGTGHFLVQLYWIVSVIGHYGGLPIYFSVPALFLLCFYLAMYSVVFALIARGMLAHFSPFVALFLLPAAWVAMDYLKSFLFTGFPWMDIGYGVASVPLLMQSADLFGHFGLSYLVILVNCFVSFGLLYPPKQGLPGAGKMALTVGVVFLCVISYSFYRIKTVNSQLETADTLRVGVVQGNIDQAQKWDPVKQGVTVKGYIDQSSALMQGVDAPELLVWPETALPFFPIRHPLLTVISSFLQEKQVFLLTGSPWFEENSPTNDGIKLYNASLLFANSGAIVQRTAKSHLVPFGEYVPLKRFLPFIAPLVEGVGDFIPGKVIDPPSCKNAEIGVLICFESIFPDISRKWVDAGANLLVNITNDAWYGKTSAPHQTLAMTKIRAVETRRSLVRSANTGFSAFIDPLGRVAEESPLYVQWRRSRSVPLMEARSFFVCGGYFFPLLCLVLTLIGLVVIQKKRFSS